MEASFSFKQFSINDDKCSMKVGTDAVLIGAWAEIGSSENILDIGSGCGVIGLMLAQRSSAHIDAIDIDYNSAQQAQTNVAESKWKGRVFVENISLQQFCKENQKKYDLIVTNPPYFSNALKSPSDKRNLARHNDKLSFDELIHGVKQLLDHYGRFCIILPENESQGFKDKALINGLFTLRALSVFPKQGKAVKRVLSEYCLLWQCSIKKEKLIIRNDDDTFTGEYKSLTRDFYLEF